ncbi:MAG TPA: PIG-L family deacetylase [Acidimicrobiales bacterium]|nr:PIG-L family deacetylase [Acidimicrobiales bacterium]
MFGDPGGPVVVLSPHLDDAVVSAWDVLRSPSAGGVQVVVPFAGVPPEGTTGRFDPVFGTDDSAALVRTRRKEDVAALAVLGRVPVHLDHLDEQYRTGPADPVELARSIAAAVAPAAAVVAPAGIGRHADHLAVRAAAIELARAWDAALWLFADLPYAANFGWPSWVTGEAPDPRLVPEAAWAGVLAEVADPVDLDVEVARFDGADRTAKLAAVRCYASQWPALEGGPHARMSNPAVAGFEVRWRVSRPA